MQLGIVDDWARTDHTYIMIIIDTSKRCPLQVKKGCLISSMHVVPCLCPQVMIGDHSKAETLRTTTGICKKGSSRMAKHRQGLEGAGR